MQNFRNLNQNFRFLHLLLMPCSFTCTCSSVSATGRSNTLRCTRLQIGARSFYETNKRTSSNKGGTLMEQATRRTENKNSHAIENSHQKHTHNPNALSATLATFHKSLNMTGACTCLDSQCRRRAS